MHAKLGSSVCAYAVTVVIAGFLSAALADDVTPTAQPPWVHERPGDAQVIRPPHEVAPVRPARVVRRGSYECVQVNVDALGLNIVDDAANEPSLAINPLDPDEIVVVWRQFDTVASDFRQAGYAYSHDGGVTWTFA
ncbi:MAG: hypothetical protein JXO22_16855, partial [Phycisphaerae bacterium]|nr:hypothetical protein [Phycisphaerae bacterium]